VKLSPVQHVTLRALARRPRQRTPNPTLDALERRGLLVSDPVPGNRAYRRYTLTLAGTEVAG
jgi:hypothetical protein